MDRRWGTRSKLFTSLSKGWSRLLPLKENGAKLWTKDGGERMERKEWWREIVSSWSLRFRIKDYQNSKGPIYSLSTPTSHGHTVTSTSRTSVWDLWVMIERNNQQYNYSLDFCDESIIHCKMLKIQWREVSRSLVTGKLLIILLFDVKPFSPFFLYLFFANVSW